MAPLLLFTRSGCCLCEGLEERLRSLEPPVPFTAVDVDSDPALQGRWGLEVPVLARSDAIAGTDPDARPQANPHAARPLPRVPPRLEGERLRQWLERYGAL